jgi:hypothetical protein
MTRRRSQRGSAVNMAAVIGDVQEAAAKDRVVGALVPKERKQAASVPETRIGKIHFGGYLDDETYKRLVLIKAHYNFNNTDILNWAVNRMYEQMVTEG